MWFESLLVYILFKFKKRLNISRIRVVVVVVVVIVVVVDYYYYKKRRKCIYNQIPYCLPPK